MPEGYMGEESYNEIEDNAKKAKQAASPLADKAIDKTADKLADHFKNKSGDKAPLNIDNKKPENTNYLNEAKKNNKNSLSELGKGVQSGLKGNKEGAKDQLKNSAINKGKAVGNTAKAGAGALKNGNIAAGIGDKAADAIKNTGRVNNGRASGDVVDGVTDAAVDAGKTAVKAGVATAKLVASGGTDVKAWVDLLKSGILKWVLFFAALPLLVIFILIFAMGGMIAEALTKLSEAFTAVSEALNPTAYDSFSMEDQYEILAYAFGDEVFRAYELMLEDVDKQIDTYASNATYNEWDKILKWNKEKGQIDYSLIYSSSDAAAGLGEQGMPDATVYIGGYEGPIQDNQWGTNDKNSIADNNSKTNPNYNKGLLKENMTLGTPGCYATGNEVYFDANEVKEAVQASAGYAAVSDMAYLVAGYNVAMMEAPIIDFGEKVSSLKAGTTIVKYKVDIAVRVFSNTVDNDVNAHGGGIWGNIVGRLEAVGEWGKNMLAEVFDQETTFFTYDASLIEVVENPMTRTVYEYTEKLYDVQEYEYTYTVTYNCDGCYCPGDHYDSGCEDTDGDGINDYCPGHSCSGCECNGHTDHPKRRYLHNDYLNGYTYDSVPSFNANDFIDDVKNSYSSYKNVSVSVESTDPYGTVYSINRSKYEPVEKQYTKYTLDIPMSAFDVDRILKALFETSPYYGEITYYYTDHDATYGNVVGETDNYAPTKIDGAQDEVLEKYGRYVAKWKYAYYDDKTPTQYTSYDGTSWEHSYVKGELYDNGIDSQPYFQQDEVYIYSCGHGRGYGISAKCPDCGQVSVQRSSDIKAKNDDGEAYYGSGDRPLTYIGTTLVQQGEYFNFIIGKKDFGTWLNDTLREIKQNSMIAMTTKDKIVIDDYTGGQVGGTVGALSGASNVGTGVGGGTTTTPGSTEGLEGTTPVTSLRGSSNTEKVWNFLQDKGLTSAQAAGIMGNMQQESCFNPGATNKSSGAYGICQWLGGRKSALQAYCSSNGFSYASLEGQLNYLWYELNTSESSALSFIRGTSTAADAAYMFGKKFERFGDNASDYAKRQKYAKSFYSTSGKSAGAASFSGDGVEGAATGGTMGTSASSQIKVVLEDANGVEYYPITVLERVLEIKNSALNVLENCDAIQAEMASRGLTYDQRYSNGTTSVSITPMAEYVSGVIRDETSYSNITSLANGTFTIGIGSWQGEEAAKLLNDIINSNPDVYAQACADAGIEELSFGDKWNSTSNPDYAKYKKVISALLDVGHSEQNVMFNEKVQKVVTYFINYHITDPATLALLSASAMYFENVTDLGTAGGTMAVFREYVMVGSINAGADNSFETAYSMLSKWLSQDGNEYSSYSVKSKIDTFYSVIKQDKENDIIPWIGSGELTPENVQPIVDLATTMTMDGYKEKFTYSQSGRYTIPRFSETLMNMYNTGEGEIIGDCSSFVAALYYCFGYNVPTSSGAWKGNSFGYVQRTDMSNMIPGDVIVWRGSNSGHVEIYIGSGQSIGFGSEPPKVHTNWNCFRYPTVSYYRIVE